MPGYRRFIAYIYDYLNGRKGNNCGYVKVELRGGACRLRLHVQPRHSGKEPVQVFGFVREAGSALAIPAGTIIQQGGVWEYQMSTSEADFAGSGYAVAKIRGLWLKCGGEDYISVWDEEPVTPQMFKLLSVDDAKERAPEEAEPVKNGRIAESMEPGEDAAGTPDASDDKAVNIRETSKAGDEEQLRERLAVARKLGYVQAQTMNGGFLDTQNISTPGEDENPMQSQETDRQNLSRPKTPAHPLTARWEHFLRHYLQIQPFADSEIVQTLSIQPKDLAFLGEEERSYCQSPFVLQAFSHYHHLLLGLHQNGRFLLGIPGECCGAQDRHFARMYGFPYYKKADNPESAGAGPAGYWYHFLYGKE